LHIRVPAQWKNVGCSSEMRQRVERLCPDVRVCVCERHMCQYQRGGKRERESVCESVRAQDVSRRLIHGCLDWMGSRSLGRKMRGERDRPDSD